jgi:hypothetical protein
MLLSREARIEALAAETRERWGWSGQCCPDVVTGLFKLKHEGRIHGYLRVPDVDLPEDEAEFDPHTGLLRMRESVFCAANDPLSSSTKKKRARFTIMHEIGHVLLEHKGTRHRNVSDRKIEKILMGTRVDEAEANRFAGAFLVPPELVDLSSSPTALQLSNEFLVSERSAEVRLQELHAIDRRKSKTKRVPPAEVLEFLREAKAKGFNITSLDDE